MWNVWRRALRPVEHAARYGARALWGVTQPSSALAQQEGHHCASCADSEAALLALAVALGAVVQFCVWDEPPGNARATVWVSVMIVKGTPRAWLALKASDASSPADGEWCLTYQEAFTRSNGPLLDTGGAPLPWYSDVLACGDPAALAPVPTDRLDVLLMRWFKACSQMRLDNAHHAAALPALPRFSMHEARLGQRWIEAA